MAVEQSAREQMQNGESVRNAVGITNDSQEVRQARIADTIEGKSESAVLNTIKNFEELSTFLDKWIADQNKTLRNSTTLSGNNIDYIKKVLDGYINKVNEKNKKNSSIPPIEISTDAINQLLKTLNGEKGIGHFSTTQDLMNSRIVENGIIGLLNGYTYDSIKDTEELQKVIENFSEKTSNILNVSQIQEALKLIQNEFTTNFKRVLNTDEICKLIKDVGDKLHTNEEYVRDLSESIPNILRQIDPGAGRFEAIKPAQEIQLSLKDLGLKSLTEDVIEVLGGDKTKFEYQQPEDSFVYRYFPATQSIFRGIKEVFSQKKKRNTESSNEELMTNSENEESENISNNVASSATQTNATSSSSSMPLVDSSQQSFTTSQGIVDTLDANGQPDFDTLEDQEEHNRNIEHAERDKISLLGEILSILKDGITIKNADEIGGASTVDSGSGFSLSDLDFDRNRKGKKSRRAARREARRARMEAKNKIPSTGTSEPTIKSQSTSKPTTDISKPTGTSEPTIKSQSTSKPTGTSESTSKPTTSTEVGKSSSTTPNTAKASKFGKIGKLGGRFIDSASGLLKGGGKLIGPAAALLEGGVGAYNAYDAYKQGNYDEASKTIVSTSGGMAGGALGAWGGAAAGAAIGSVVPVIGTAIGGLIGGALGAWVGSKGGEVVASAVGDATGATDKLSNWLGENAKPITENKKQEIDDVSKKYNVSSETASNIIDSKDNIKKANNDYVKNLAEIPTQIEKLKESLNDKSLSNDEKININNNINELNNKLKSSKSALIDSYNGSIFDSPNTKKRAKELFAGDFDVTDEYQDHTIMTYKSMMRKKYSEQGMKSEDIESKINEELKKYKEESVKEAVSLNESRLSNGEDLFTGKDTLESVISKSLSEDESNLFKDYNRISKYNFNNADNYKSFEESLLLNIPDTKDLLKNRTTLDDSKIKEYIDSLYKSLNTTEKLNIDNRYDLSQHLVKKDEDGNYNGIHINSKTINGRPVIDEKLKSQGYKLIDEMPKEEQDYIRKTLLENSIKRNIYEKMYSYGDLTEKEKEIVKKKSNNNFSTFEVNADRIFRSNDIKQNQIDYKAKEIKRGEDEFASIQLFEFDESKKNNGNIQTFGEKLDSASEKLEKAAEKLNSSTEETNKSSNAISNIPEELKPQGKGFNSNNINAIQNDKKQFDMVSNNNWAKRNNTTQIPDALTNPKEFKRYQEEKESIRKYGKENGYFDENGTLKYKRGEESIHDGYERLRKAYEASKFNNQQPQIEKVDSGVTDIKSNGQDSAIVTVNGNDVTVPALATDSNTRKVVNSPTLAVVGEKGPEIISPIQSEYIKSFDVLEKSESSGILNSNYNIGNIIRNMPVMDNIFDNSNNDIIKLASKSSNIFGNNTQFAIDKKDEMYNINSLQRINDVSSQKQRSEAISKILTQKDALERQERQQPVNVTGGSTVINNNYSSVSNGGGNTRTTVPVPIGNSAGSQSFCYNA